MIRTHTVPREAVPTELLVQPRCGTRCSPTMPLTAMIRNLATMTRVGLLTPGASATKTVVARLGDKARLAKARVHPVAVLAALLTYKSGRGARGSSTWSPVGKVVDALDGAFYATFKSVEPTGKRMLLALDVSGSMSCGTVAGVPGLSPRVGSAAMALVTAATERDHTLVGFSTELTPLAISPRQRLDDAVAAIDRVPMGGTDCAQPMIWAAQQQGRRGHVRRVHGQRDLGRERAPGPGPAHLPRGARDPGQAGGGRDDVERVHDRGPQRRRHARRGRFRHVDPAGDQRLRPRPGMILGSGCRRRNNTHAPGAPAPRRVLGQKLNG